MVLHIVTSLFGIFSTTFKWEFLRAPPYHVHRQKKKNRTQGSNPNPFLSQAQLLTTIIHICLCSTKKIDNVNIETVVRDGQPTSFPIQAICTRIVRIQKPSKGHDHFHLNIAIKMFICTCIQSSEQCLQVTSSVQGNIFNVYNETCLHSAFKASLFICTSPFRNHKVYMCCVLKSSRQLSRKWKWFCVEHDR